jgi:uncharacterized protein YciI
MRDRYLFVYFMKDDPGCVAQVAPQHVRYWHEMDLPGYMGGPFADRTGGSISFETGSELEAKHLVGGDPFVVANLLSQSWLKEWQVR